MNYSGKYFIRRKRCFSFRFSLVFLAIVLGFGQVLMADIGLYHTYYETKMELQNLAWANPTRAQFTSIGHGWEIVGEFGAQRGIWALKISDNVTEDEGEPEIVFVGCHHAREWISVEVPLAIANHLLNNYDSDPDIRELVDNKVIWVIPMLNPDGHQYSVITDRCWRKNRRDNGDGTFGVDPNRNYGYQWGVSGSSPTTSSDTYRGPFPFSEPETQALRDFLYSRTNVRALISYHSYTQAVLRPWSYTLNFTPGDPPPPGELMMKDISDQLRARIQAVHGETYKDCISQADRLPSGRCEWPHYACSGELTDWVYHEFNIPAFTIELRPRSMYQWTAPLGCEGFELPESEIAPTIEENLPAALTLIRNTQEGNIMIRDYEGDTGVVPSATMTSSGWSRVFWLSPDISSSPTVPIRGGTATITAQVHNLTSDPVNNVTVQIWYSDPDISLHFPSSHSNLIGEDTIDLPAGGSEVFSAVWSVPSVPNVLGYYHWCVGVVIKHPEDLPVNTFPTLSNNVAIRNFWPIEVATTSGSLPFQAVNDFSIDADLDIFVTTEGLPKGWEVRLDPDRPKILKPGERYLGFAEVIVPEDSDAGESLVQIQGALTPRRPGAVNPIGSGIDYQVTYKPPCIGPAVPKFWLNFHLDYGFPLGTFKDNYRPGPGISLDLECSILSKISVIGQVGYHYFHGRGKTDDLSYTNLTINGRGYFSVPPWRGFIQGGAGFYIGDPGPNNFGLNFGLGLEFSIRPKLSLELSVDAHWIDPKNLKYFFLDPTFGIKFAF